MRQKWYRTVNRKDTQTLCSSYWTTVRIHMYAISTARLHYICRQREATWRFLGYYLRTLQRSTPGMTIDPPHFSLQQNTELQLSCDYCWTIMQTHKHATTTETLPCIVPHCAIASRMLK